MLGPYPTNAVIEQLALSSELKIVDGAAGLEIALNTPPRAEPAVYVITEETSKGGADFTEYGRARVQVVVKAVIWVRHAGTAETGSKAVARMREAEAVVRDQLLGFVPADVRAEGLTFRASGADKYYGNSLIRQVLFDGAYDLTKESP